MHVRFTLAACVLMSLPATALAQEQTCHESGTRAVQEIPNAEMVGATFFVSGATTGCVSVAADASIVIGDGSDALWFADLRGDKLVLTRSTGPQGDLIVHDLTSDVRLLDVPADEFEADDTGIVYWERSEAATRENCDQFAEYEANGFGAVIAERKLLVFSERQPVATGERRCDPTQ